MKYLKPLLLAALLIPALSFSARADYYVWRDVNTGLSLSYPDSWKMVNNAQADDIITLAAPSGDDHAACRLRALEDKRWLIYPPRYSAAVQKTGFSRHFWDYYLNEYSDPQILTVRDNAGLGHAFATFAVAGYRSAVPGPFMQRKALMFAGLYNDTVFIAECSAAADHFDIWRDQFMGIIKSVDFRKTHHELPTGNYRDFLSEPRFLFRGDEGDNIVVY